MMMHRFLPAAVFATLVCLSTDARAARTIEDCQLAWGQAARSYMTGKQGGPQDGDFKVACELESKGDKDNARVEAVMVATAGLAKVSAEVCERFLVNYVGIKEAAPVCAAASEDPTAFKKVVTDALPPPGKGKPKKK
ncbi:MAG: hypothetical protein HY904_09755 [Deltaproteobacteria bacterium]|nr:hypothetical protein [Deltaproteobacteria bacterium]